MNNRFNSEDKIILAIDGLDVSQAKLLLEKLLDELITIILDPFLHAV